MTVAIPNWFNQIYKDLILNMDEGTIGGAFFEYSDELYSKTDVLQQTMGIVASNISADNLGKTSEEMNMFIPDAIFKKPIYYALLNGSVDGIKYNYNSDVFALMGRNKTVLGSAQCTVTSNSTTGKASTSSTGSVTGATSSSTGSGSTGSVSGGSSTGQQQGSSAGFDERSSSEQIVASVIITTLLLFLGSI